VAQPEPGRKGLRAVLRLLGLLIVSGVVSFPIAFIIAIMMSPWLGRLEERHGVELVGHSGPSDWIYATVFGITTILVFAFFLWLAQLIKRPNPDIGGRGADERKRA
jgi:hypothetical protein